MTQYIYLKKQKLQSETKIREPFKYAEPCMATDGGDHRPSGRYERLRWAYFYFAHETLPERDKSLQDVHSDQCRFLECLQ